MSSTATTTLSYLIWAYLKGAHGYQLYTSSQILHSSYVAVVNLRVHEKETEKAAEYSQTVADQLWKIRTTQASGVITGFVSLISSAYLLLLGTSSPSSLSLSSSQVLLSVSNVVLTAAVSQYIAAFWANSARIPFVKSYNEALRHTDRIVSVLRSSTVAWLLSLPVSCGTEDGYKGVRFLFFRFGEY